VHVHDEDTCRCAENGQNGPRATGAGQEEITLGNEDTNNGPGSGGGDASDLKMRRRLEASGRALRLFRTGRPEICPNPLDEAWTAPARGNQPGCRSRYDGEQCVHWKTRGVVESLAVRRAAR